MNVRKGMGDARDEDVRHDAAMGDEMRARRRRHCIVDWVTVGCLYVLCYKKQNVLFGQHIKRKVVGRAVAIWDMKS